MKDLNIKLSDLNGQELTDQEKASFRGGEAIVKCCQCGCCYEGDPGGSTSEANLDANFDGSLYSPCIPEGEGGCAYHQNNGTPFHMDWCTIIPQ